MINKCKIYHKNKIRGVKIKIGYVSLLFLSLLFLSLTAHAQQHIGDNCLVFGCVYNADSTPVPEGVVVNIEYNGNKYQTATYNHQCWCGRENGNYYQITSDQMDWQCHDGIFVNASANHNGYYGENSMYVNTKYPTFLDIYLTESVGCTDTSYTLNFSEWAGQWDQWWIGISIPLCIDETNISEILSGIAGQYDRVERLKQQQRKGYESFLPMFPPIASEFTTMDDGIEYQIHFIVPNPNNITINGKFCSLNETITLHPGWNPFGWPCSGTVNISEILSGIAGDYDRVERLKKGPRKQYESFLPMFPPIASEFTTFEPWGGYQIHITADHDVTLNYNCERI
ncbi:hypothetical protein BEH94_04095 [Candidatus Altiarchaeales archaeon WOR_SM1_SCG]|nr:hypothetical protein BEH94_04095 [Candidatus Altiarchaeales archaeon WOR_SM1_SCG]